MPTCKDCANYTLKSADAGECKIIGPAPPDRDSGRCPVRTFMPRTGEPKKDVPKKRR